MVTDPLRAALQPDAVTLGDRISHALGRPAQLGPERITVAIRGTKVTLDGAVRSQRELKMAAAVALATRGVTEVENRLDVA